MSNRPRLTKRLNYRDLSGASQAAHLAHWLDFQWEGGPVQVRCAGPWGQPQVYAASEAEGRRVLEHAAAIAGWDLSPGGPAQWDVAQVTDGRIGKTGTFRVMYRNGVPRVSKRNGPSGAPLEDG